MRRPLWLTLLLLTALPFLTAAGLAVRSGWWMDTLEVKHARIPSNGELGAWNVVRLGSIGGQGFLGSIYVYAPSLAFTSESDMDAGWSLHTTSERITPSQRATIPSQQWANVQANAGKEDIAFELLGVKWFIINAKLEPAYYPRNSKIRMSGVIVPFWWSLPLLSLPPLLTLLLYRRSARRRLIREGRCVGCGYDLRGSPGRCPECGLGPEGLQSPHHDK